MEASKPNGREGAEDARKREEAQRNGHVSARANLYLFATPTLLNRNLKLTNLQQKKSRSPTKLTPGKNKSMRRFSPRKEVVESVQLVTCGQHFVGEGLAAGTDIAELSVLDN